MKKYVKFLGLAVGVIILCSTAFFIGQRQGRNLERAAIVPVVKVSSSDTDRAIALFEERLEWAKNLPESERGKGKIYDYRIEKVTTEVRNTEGGRIVYCIDYAIKVSAPGETWENGKDGIFVGTNGKIADDGWIVRKEAYVTISKDNGTLEIITSNI